MADEFKIPKQLLDAVTKMIEQTTSDAKAKMLNAINRVNIEADPDKAFELLEQAFEMVCSEYGTIAAQVNVDAYNAIRQKTVGEPLENYKTVTGYSPMKTAAAFTGYWKALQEGSRASFQNYVMNHIDYEMQRAGGNAMFEMGKSDPLKPRYARVPAGPDACKFCVMLASRGPVYHSEETAGLNKHYHAHDRCRIVPMWDVKREGLRYKSQKTVIEGYDPDELYEQYLDFKNKPGIKKKADRVTEQVTGKPPKKGDHGSIWTANADRVTLHSLKEVGEYINGAETYEDLFDRQELIEKEFPFYGLEVGGEGWKSIAGTLRSKRRKLLGKDQLEVIQDTKDVNEGGR